MTPIRQSVITRRLSIAFCKGLNKDQYYRTSEGIAYLLGALIKFWEGQGFKCFHKARSKLVRQILCIAHCGVS